MVATYIQSSEFGKFAEFFCSLVCDSGTENRKVFQVCKTDNLYKRTVIQMYTISDTKLPQFGHFAEKIGIEGNGSSEVHE